MAKKQQFVACIECRHGFYGDKSCPTGSQVVVHKGQGCFWGLKITRSGKGVSSVIPTLMNRIGTNVLDL